MTRLGKAARDRQKQERAAIEAEVLAEQERVHALGQLFEALPDGPAKAALQEAMSDRVIDLYNNVRWETGRRYPRVPTTLLRATTPGLVLR